MTVKSDLNSGIESGTEILRTHHESHDRFKDNIKTTNHSVGIWWMGSSMEGNVQGLNLRTIFKLRHEIT